MTRRSLLYPHSHTPSLEQDVFQNPPCEYRGAPLWSWNCKLEIPQLLKQIDDMHSMGLGGFHIHPRTGLATEYLGDEFMAAVKACVEKAKELGMRCYLYDEDRWPSGAAGGLVTEDPEHAVKHLRWTAVPYGSEVSIDPKQWPPRNPAGKFIAAFSANLQRGYLSSYERLEREVAEEHYRNGERIWFAYLEHGAPWAWLSGRPYVDCLSSRAIKRFLDITHERYKEVIGPDFGGVVPSIFTDEPQFSLKGEFARPEDVTDVVFPYTTDLGETYRATYGTTLEDTLPELFWELPGGVPSLARYRFHDHVCERFTEAFSDQVGAWCDQNGIMLTGHLMEESTLGKQTCVLGEAMRGYRSFHLPGIDMLCDWMELMTAKQAQSASRQFGREGVLSELYGVTNWDFTFAGHKRQGDWQAALGVTLRVHHLTWVSMGGEAKRDYPASIGYQSPWYEEYPLVENHFARVNSAMTRGKAICRVAVIHPVESYWLAFGPLSQTSSEREELESNFKSLTEWLLYGMVDFDFVSESLLPSQYGAPGDQFHVGEMNYDVVILPDLRTIRATTLDALERFTGNVLVLGGAPNFVDAQVSDRGKALTSGRKTIPFSRSAVLEELRPFKEIIASNPDGTRTDSLIHQLREENDSRYGFICNTDGKLARSGIELRFRGEWIPQVMDTLTGQSAPKHAKYEEGWTVLEQDFPAHGSILLSLVPGRSETPNPKLTTREEIVRLDSPVPISLSEPNVLLLDQAWFRVDGGEWEGPEETLRIENILRDRLGLRKHNGDVPQPWLDTAPKPELARLELRFDFESNVSVNGAHLAQERPQDAVLRLDGIPVPNQVTGYFVDESIKQVALPSISPGKHSLIIEIPFNRTTTVEWSYLLGDFSVTVEGRTASLGEPVRHLAFGDWCNQGLPFYAGNVTYHCSFKVQDSANYSVRVPHFKAPVLRAAVDGGKQAPIAFDPFELSLGDLEHGEHKLEITAFGSRINAFGQVHCFEPERTWFGPDSWRTQGKGYSYEYQLKPSGILSAPTICREQ